MLEVQSTLLGLAEVAIALAGFSAIVVIFKRGRDGKWSVKDADQFHGVVVHAVFAVGFCFFPSVINLLVQDVSTSLHIACAVFGTQIVLHAGGVLLVKFPGLLVVISLVLGLIIGLVQFTVFTDWGVNRELEIYVVGIIWHAMQAGLLFVLLIWIAREDIDVESTADSRPSDGQP